MDSICTFHFNEKRSYFCGEDVTGVALWRNDSEKKVKNISFMLIGRTKVRFRNAEVTAAPAPPAGKKSKKACCDFKGHNYFLSKVLHVNSDAVFPAGTYGYEFRFNVPAQGETSYESAYGQVRYELLLLITMEDDKVLNFIEPITVIGRLDLNTSLHYMTPRKCMFKTISWCLYQQRHSIVYNLKTNFSAYVPGQMMKYSLQIINMNCERYKGFIIGLIKVVTYTATQPSIQRKRCTTTLISRTVVATDFSNNMYSDFFHIPATPPTTSSSSLIHIEYFLQVTVLLPEFNSTLEIKLPITIGAVPTIAAIPKLAEFVLKQPLTILHVVLIKSLHLLWPPTYQAAQKTDPFIDPDIEKIYRIIGFKPAYPVYKMPTANERQSII